MTIQQNKICLVKQYLLTHTYVYTVTANVGRVISPFILVVKFSHSCCARNSAFFEKVLILFSQHSTFFIFASLFTNILCTISLSLSTSIFICVRCSYSTYTFHHCGAFHAFLILPANVNCIYQFTRLTFRWLSYITLYHVINNGLNSSAHYFLRRKDIKLGKKQL